MEGWLPLILLLVGAVVLFKLLKGVVKIVALVAIVALALWWIGSGSVAP